MATNTARHDAPDRLGRTGAARGDLRRERCAGSRPWPWALRRASAASRRGWRTRRWRRGLGRRPPHAIDGHGSSAGGVYVDGRRRAPRRVSGAAFATTSRRRRCVTEDREDVDSLGNEGERHRSVTARRRPMKRSGRVSEVGEAGQGELAGFGLHEGVFGAVVAAGGDERTGRLFAGCGVRGWCPASRWGPGPDPHVVARAADPRTVARMGW